MMHLLRLCHVLSSLLEMTLLKSTWDDIMGWLSWTMPTNLCNVHLDSNRKQLTTQLFLMTDFSTRSPVSILQSRSLTAHSWQVVFGRLSCRCPIPAMERVMPTVYSAPISMHWTTQPKEPFQGFEQQVLRTHSPMCVRQICTRIWIG